MLKEITVENFPNLREGIDIHIRKPREFQISQGHAAINNKDQCKDSGSVLSEFKAYAIEHHLTVSYESSFIQDSHQY